MITLPFLVLALASFTVTRAAPLQKRIAQTIAEATAPWEQACVSIQFRFHSHAALTQILLFKLAAGGGQQCNPISLNSMTTLLLAAGPCDQQNAADSMIDLAKQLNDDADMIRLAQIFVQQPRNSPNSVSIPYCQQAPKNAELDGLFQCQFQGVDPLQFTTGGAGTPGTIPFGLDAPVSPTGSCAAHPQGPVANGEQLNVIVQSPGVG